MNCGPEDSIGRAGGPAVGGRTDTLDYITDIIQELKRLAEKAGYRSLAAILCAAHTEARIQSEEQDR